MATDIEDRDDMPSGRYFAAQMAESILFMEDEIAMLRSYKQRYEELNKLYGQVVSQSISHSSEMSGLLLRAAIGGAFTGSAKDGMHEALEQILTHANDYMANPASESSLETIALIQRLAQAAIDASAAADSGLGELAQATIEK